VICRSGGDRKARPRLPTHPSKLVTSVGRLPKFDKATLADITKEEKHWLKRFRVEGARHVSGNLILKP